MNCVRPPNVPRSVTGILLSPPNDRVARELPLGVRRQRARRVLQDQPVLTWTAGSRHAHAHEREQCVRGCKWNERRCRPHAGPNRPPHPRLAAWRTAPTHRSDSRSVPRISRQSVVPWQSAKGCRRSWRFSSSGRSSAGSTRSGDAASALGRSSGHGRPKQEPWAPSLLNSCRASSHPLRARSELAPQSMRAIQIALPRGIVGAVDSVEVLMLDVLDARIGQREFVDHHAHGVA